MAIEVATFGEQNELFFSDQTPPELVNRLNSIGVEPDLATKEAMFQDVLTNFPTLLDGYIAYYKFLFRTAQFAKAERIIWRTLKEAARQGGFHWNCRLLKIDTAPWLEDHGVARLYLFSLKALGVVRLRQSKVIDAHRVLNKLLELDPYDEIGGGNFHAIASSFLEEEDEE